MVSSAYNVVSRFQTPCHTIHVDFDVLREVVGAREPFLTYAALVRLDTGMGTLVTRQLIGTGKSPFAALPRTYEGFLTSMPAQVSFEMGTLGVHLAAVRVSAFVDLQLIRHFSGASAPSRFTDSPRWDQVCLRRVCRFDGLLAGICVIRTPDAGSRAILCPERVCKGWVSLSTDLLT